MTSGGLLELDAIGTRWQIETARPLSPAPRARIQDVIEDYDRTWSRFRPDSLVTEIAAAPAGGRFELPRHAVALLDLYDRLHELTDGALDPLVGRDLELLGYDATYSLRAAPLPDRVRAHERRARWPDVRRRGRTITTDRPVLIDVGAAGKGQLVDLVAQVLEDEGVEAFVVDAGGDLRQRGDAPIRVGLEHPLDALRVVGTVDLHDRALCASAANRRAWGPGLHHVLDARTGTCVDRVLATWVIAETAMLADGLATALFLTEPDRLQPAFGFSFVRMRPDGLETSDGFEGETFA
ncbi:FAD:protein FMN transferase [Solirubrobacter phytolaccae]|uniref:FAD:protein FMN transferase n=1 Tax=Solirubrobacter phytolaccae TaxID=1404360 RepID=A0A9X3SFC8_9ACTN|nr:FAD:protein FMN transferase [Solirubrobacter phytolaccae]MDA0181337.1 FAD:protein FMN transferase [Solirubrobacter phytolaccae]